jgi:hypothetical protein
MLTLSLFIYSQDGKSGAVATNIPVTMTARFSIVVYRLISNTVKGTVNGRMNA